MPYDNNSLPRLILELQRVLEEFICSCKNQRAITTVSKLLESLSNADENTVEKVTKQIQIEFDDPLTSVTDMPEQDDVVLAIIRRVSLARKALGGYFSAQRLGINRVNLD